jgi:hypothetical protein
MCLYANSIDTEKTDKDMKNILKELYNPENYTKSAVAKEDAQQKTEVKKEEEQPKYKKGTFFSNIDLSNKEVKQSKAYTEYPVKSLGIISVIDKHIEQKKNEPRFGFHPSSISLEDPFCARYHAFRHTRDALFQTGIFETIEEANQALSIRGRSIDVALQRVFDTGHALHSMYQNDYLSSILWGKWERYNKETKLAEEHIGHKPEGRGWEYIEPTIKNSEYEITGHTDGILRINDEWYLLEIKSANDASWSFMHSPRDAHQKQAQLYLHSTLIGFEEIEPKGVVFLYVNKNTSKEKEFLVLKDSTMIQPIFDGLKLFYDCLDKQELPSKVCLRKKCPRANDCPAQELCFMLDAGIVGAKQLQNMISNR